MKQNHIGEETRRHRNLNNHRNVTSGQLFLASKPAVGPEKLLFPQSEMKSAPARGWSCYSVNDVGSVFIS